MQLSNHDLHYLKLLARSFSNADKTAEEILNLTALLNLPKRTEFFVSDLHGEYEPFLHMLRNASGVIRRKIDEEFKTMPEEEKANLATLIYYPESKYALLKQKAEDRKQWLTDTIMHLVKLARISVSKHTIGEIREALRINFGNIVEEMIHDQEDLLTRRSHYEAVVESIIETGTGREVVSALAHVIRKFSIDHLHVIGDIYDRGPGAHIIMDTFMDYHSIDIQWGNHDILWMGAAAGHAASIANVVRVALRYSNMITLEDAYAISLTPLAAFALEFYADDPCRRFQPKPSDEKEFTEKEKQMMAKMHKAIAVIQFKLEGEVIRRRPEYKMDDRLLLDKVDYTRGIITIQGKEYELNDKNFPTIDPANPYALTPDEKNVVDKLVASFTNSARLQTHVRFLFAKGSMYTVYNENLLFHGSIDIEADGTFTSVGALGSVHRGRELLDKFDEAARRGFFAADPEEKLHGMDAMWYLWCGPASPLFGKDRMATYERYFISEEETHVEGKSAYFEYRDQEPMASAILAEFGLTSLRSHIINGHVPVKVVKGESPVKAGGKLIVIDGGLSRAYQKTTGIAGYTLIYNSYGLLLASHKPFVSTQEAIESSVDIDSETTILEENLTRLSVKDSDEGKIIVEQMQELKKLLYAYREGLIKEEI